MPKAIGIDFGYRNCRVAIKYCNNIRILENRENEDATPSVVGYHKGQFIVGNPAVDRMVSAPNDTIISIKSLMGRAYSDPYVQRVKKYYQYEIVPSDGKDGDVMVVLGGKQYSPVQISAMIFKKLKQDAERRLNDTVEYAVITVPAYFTDKQREAVRKAGQLAGLKVQKILEEPTAVSIAYGMLNTGCDDSKTVMIYDFGGNNFDVSVLNCIGGNMCYLDIEGDVWLRGDNFDHKIMDYVLEYVQKKYNIDARRDLIFMLRLKEQAEKAKKSLSSIDSTEILILALLKNEERDFVGVEVVLTRDQFERMIEPDVKGSIDLVCRAIQNSYLTKDQIDHVLLVGGSSTIPMIRRALIDLFGEGKILTNVDPLNCVAQGAAILAEMIGKKIECQKCKHLNPAKAKVCEAEGCGEPLTFVFEITGQPYGTQTIADEFVEIIPKGSKIPSEVPVIVTIDIPPSEKNTKKITIPLYAGFNPVASKNELMSTVWLELPENVPQNASINVAFSLDMNRIINVKASLNDGSGREVHACIDRDLGDR